MKKLLVVVLAAAVIFGFASTASADVSEMGKLPNVTRIDSVFPDAKNETQQVKDDTAKMYALGVFEGLPNGTFAYDNTMTRAELAKTVTYLSDSVASANALQTSKSSYPDVKTAVWYTGWVNNVTTSGQMIGYPNGNFGPNDKVTVAELVTATMRTLGYNDKLAGNWPYDYMAQAAKLGLTKNINTNDVKRIADRRDLVQICANVLSQSMVAWDAEYNRFIPYAASAYRVLDDEADYPFWSGWTKSITWDFTNLMQMAPMDLLEYAFNGRVMPAVTFNDDPFSADDALDAWYLENYKAGEIALCAWYLDDEDEYDYMDDTVLAPQYFISDNYTVFDLAHMQADLIYTADGRGMNASGDVVYVDVTSSYAMTDDIVVSDYLDLDLTIDGKVTRLTNDFWDNLWGPVEDLLEDDDLAYAKVFYNDKGRVYCVTDLQAWYPGTQGVYDAWSADDETIDFYTTNQTEPGDVTYDIEDEYVIPIKDKAFVRMADLDSMDVVTMQGGEFSIWFTGQDEPQGPEFHSFYGHNDDVLALLADEFQTGKFTEGDDDYLTIGGVEYPYAAELAGLFGYESQLNETGGNNGDWVDLTNVDQLDDAFDKTVSFATNRSGYGLTFFFHGEGASSSDVYGVVTDINISNTTSKIKDVTILNQKGEEVTYGLDINKKQDPWAFESTASDVVNIQLGSYVEVKVNKDKDIVSYTEEAEDTRSLPNLPEFGEFTTAVYFGDNLDIDRNGKRININGAWYTIDSSTVIWNTTWDSVDYTSADFDSAEIVNNADLKQATSLDCEGYVLAASKNGVLKRLYVIEGQVYSATKYDVITKVSKKADGWNLQMLLAGATVYDEDGYFFGEFGELNIPTSMAPNSFVAYTTTGDGKYIYPRGDGDTDVQDVNWVILNLDYTDNGSYPNGYIKDGRPLEATEEDGDTSNGYSYWVTADADYQGLPGWGPQSTDVMDYVTQVNAKTVSDGDVTLSLGTEDVAYYLADDVKVILVADDGTMSKGSVSDIKASTTATNTPAEYRYRVIMGISIDENQPQYELGYVFVLDKDHPLALDYNRNMLP